MKHLDKDIAVAQTVVLMTSYSFDLQGYTLEQLISKWIANYHSTWIRLATIEALYLGRYKAISIEQIMGVWYRLGEPKAHFGGEFERLICRKLPRHLLEDRDSDRVLPNNLNSYSARSSIGTSNNGGSPKKKNPIGKKMLSPSLEILDAVNSHLNNELESSTSSSLDSFETDSPSVLSNTESNNQEAIPSPVKIDSLNTQSSSSIEGFNPIPDMSSLYQKLKAIAKIEN